MKRFRLLTLIFPFLLCGRHCGWALGKRLEASSRSADELNELLKTYARGTQCCRRKLC